MTVRAEAFIAIEKSVASRLLASWEAIAQHYILTVESLIEQQEWEQAYKVANSLSLSTIVDDNREYLRFASYSALLFGASRLTDDLKQSIIVQGHGDFSQIIEKSLDQMATAFEYSIAEQLRRQLTSLIEDEEIQSRTTLFGPSEKVKIRKYSPDQPRDPKGSPTGGQFTRAGVQSAAFKEWFGDSKIVNADGSPMVVYHATNRDPEHFLPFSHFGTAGAANDRMKNLYDFSVGTVGRDPGNFQVLPVYLSIQNPLRLPDIADYDSSTGKHVSEIPPEDFYSNDWEGEEALSTHLLYHDIIDIDEFEEHRSFSKAIKLLEEKGYDGIVYENTVEDAGKDSYIVFKPTQVKSAIGNSGAFDPKDKRITKDEWDETPMYVKRTVINAQEIINWAKRSGFDTVLPPEDLHVTVMYSREPVAWDQFQADTQSLVVEGGKRVLSPLGDGGAIVLKFQSAELKARWQQFITGGASWDYESYQPHITLTYQGPDESTLEKIAAYSGPIELGPEIFEALDLDWKDQIVEKAEWDESKHPRYPAGSGKGGEFRDNDVLSNLHSATIDVLSRNKAGRLAVNRHWRDVAYSSQHHYATLWQKGMIQEDDFSGDPPKKTLDRVAAIDSLFDQVKPTTEDITVYRGTQGIGTILEGVDPLSSDYTSQIEALKGKEYTEGLFASTSTDIGEADRWGHRGTGALNDNVLLKIRIPKGSKVLSSPKASFDEDEILLSHKAHFKITGAKKEQVRLGVTRIVVEVDLIGKDQVVEKYDPSQPREPKGSPHGGQWAKNPTSTAAFQEWFKGSKVVNEDGSPKVVYHGSIDDFSEFNTEGGGREHGLLNQMIGTHFAEDPDVTDAFSIGQYRRASSSQRLGTIPVLVRESGIEPYNPERHGPTWGIRERIGADLVDIKSGGQIYPVYLSIKNPLVVEYKEREFDQTSIARAVSSIVYPKSRELFVSSFQSTGHSAEVAGEMWDALSKGKTYSLHSETYSSFTQVADNWSSLISSKKDIAKAKKILQSLGYDGIRYQNTSGNEVRAEDNPTSWIAFEPEQIKSAIGNVGTFDPKSKNILKEDFSQADLDVAGRKSPEQYPKKKKRRWVELWKFDPSQPRDPKGSPTGGQWTKTQTSVGPVTESAAFKKWFGKSQVVDEYGEPLVTYHGTTGDFSEFAMHRSSVESDWGAGIYTSDSAADVSSNYAGEGPDLTNKLEFLAENIMQSAADEGEEISMEEAKNRARRELGVEHGGLLVPVYLKMENPFRVTQEKETVLEYEFEYDEKTDTYGEPKGKAHEFIMALKDIAEGYQDGDTGDLINELQTRAMDYNGIRASEIYSIVKKDEKFSYYTNSEGKFVSKEILRAALEEIGFDGIIDQTVEEKFSRMENIAGATHYVVFKPTQVKSAIGNVGTFDPHHRSIIKADRIVKPFVPFNTRGNELMQLIANLHTSRLSAYGFTAEADVLQVSEYAISAQLDNRICPVCEEMHGRTFDVYDARQLLELTLRETDPQTLKLLQPWPSQKPEDVAQLHEMTPGQITSRGWHIPPYHPNCRCLLVHVGRVPKLQDTPSYRAAFNQPLEEKVSTVSDFEAYGLVPPGDKELQTWNTHVKVTPGDFLANTLGRSPQEMMDTVHSGKSLGVELLTRPAAQTVELNFNTKAFDSTKPVAGNLKLKFDEGKAQIDEIRLQPEDQSIGIPKKLLKNWVALCRKLGLKEVRLTANTNLGGYAYAKYGFKPTLQSWEDLSFKIRNSLFQLRKFFPDLKDIIDGILNLQDPRANWLLADIRDEDGVAIGKQILAGLSWDAVLELDDDLAMIKFDHFFKV